MSVDSRNVRWNVFEVFVTGVLLFAIYRLIAHELGLAAMGIWSLVVSTISVARIADVGAAAGLSRYVALSRQRSSDGTEALIYVETAFIMSLIFYIVLALILYLPARTALSFAMHGSVAKTAFILLPVSLISFVLSSLFNVLSAALMGIGRSDVKSKISIFSSLVQFASAFLLIRKFGLVGLAISQGLQATFCIIAAWQCIVSNLRGKVTLAIPYRIRKGPLSDVLGFGMRLQALNLAAFLFDPFLKFVLSAVGGLAAVGAYEMANRVVQQVRQAIVAPSLNLTPVFAMLNETDRVEFKKSVLSATARISAIGFLAMTSIVVISPAISLFWLSNLNIYFLFCVFCLSISWFVNIACVSGYLVGVATGKVAWNIAGACFTTVVGPLFGLTLSHLVGPWAIIPAAGISIAGGAAITHSLNCYRLGFAPIPPVSVYKEVVQKIIVAIFIRMDRTNRRGTGRSI